MIPIDDKIVSDDLLEVQFACNLDENALASKITQTARQQAYLASGHAPI